MSSYLIYGGARLEGEIEVDRSKNALLPIIAASILIPGEVRLERVPPLLDIQSMLSILKTFGARVEFGGDLVISTANASPCRVPEDKMRALRASIFLLGGLLSRFGQAVMSQPGGCNIGLRPIDIHLEGLRALGVKIVEKNGYIYATGKPQAGCVVLPLPSVGATENLIMASVLSRGVTTIIGAAKEPEIVDLARFLNLCGARVHGAGSDKIEIEGQESLHGCTFVAMHDRILAGTLLLSAAMTRGHLVIKGAKSQENIQLVSKLRASACTFYEKDDIIDCKFDRRLAAFGSLSTAPYPALASDMQQLISSAASIADGVTILRETVFEGRFKHVGELVKMGADIHLEGRTQIIAGKQKLFGASVEAFDLRGGAALVLAGLVAEGYTTVRGGQIIERGYFDLEGKFGALGGSVKRIEGDNI